MTRRLVGIRPAARPYLEGPEGAIAWAEIDRIATRCEGPTFQTRPGEPFWTTIMPNEDVLVWVADDVDERFEVIFIGPYT